MKTLDIRFGIILFITLVCISVTIVRGNQVIPQVTFFNAEEQEIHPSSKQLYFTFNREMQKKTVESSFIIDPYIPGKFSWVGKKMVYTFTKNLKYGKKYDIYIEEGTDVYNKHSDDILFTSRFYTSPRTLYYIGVTGDEKDRLISYNIENGKYPFFKTGC